MPGKSPNNGRKQGNGDIAAYTMDFDAFTFGGESYSEDKFYTSASDKRGHSEQARVTFPQGILSQILAIVQSGSIPQYKTVQHFIRDAVYHRLKYLQTHNVKVDEKELSAIGLSNTISKYESYIDTLDNAESTIRQVLEKARSSQDYEAINSIIDDVSDAMDNIPESYRQRINLLLKRYKELIRSNQE